MRKSTFPIFLLLALVTLDACSTAEQTPVSSPLTTRPYETSVDKIFQLTTGMKLADVSRTLGCQPIEFYFDGSTGCKVVEYRYRRKYHNAYEKTDIRYRDEKKLFALFYQDALREIITSSGQELSIPIMIDETNIRDACSYDGRPVTKQEIIERYFKAPQQTEGKEGKKFPSFR
jgi:hypothetical protein